MNSEVAKELEEGVDWINGGAMPHALELLTIIACQRATDRNARIQALHWLAAKGESFAYRVLWSVMLETTASGKAPPAALAAFASDVVVGKIEKPGKGGARDVDRDWRISQVVQGLMDHMSKNKAVTKLAGRLHKDESNIKRAIRRYENRLEGGA